MITFKQKGDFSKLTKYLNEMKKPVRKEILNRYGAKGVSALASATPVESGKTAASWRYEVKDQNGSISIEFLNSNINKGVPIAVILQYGHGTRNGGWVQGRDYINPAIQPVFDQIVEDIWKEVMK